MQNDSELQARIQNLSDKDLAKMIEDAADYLPEANAFAQEEMLRRGGLETITAVIAQTQQCEEEKITAEYAEKPLFLYIPIGRLIAMSILTFGVYECYWMYKNWRYIKERDRLDIRPFARGWFGIVYCRSLLRRMYEDKDARAIQMPTFWPRALAFGWIVLFIISVQVGCVPKIGAGIAAFVPSFLCLVPVQKYVNRVNERRIPGLPFNPWSTGHLVCLCAGIGLWALLIINLDR